jgi:uncharacterized protein
MKKQLWINLPVQDVERSRKFFSHIGFRFNEQQCNGDQAACMLVGEPAIVVMLFKNTTFEGFVRHNLADTAQGSEVLFSIDAADPDEVEAIAQKVVDAGGTLFSIPQSIQGWMYGCGFSDPDGHRWNVLYMDHSKMPKPEMKLEEVDC